MILLENDVVIMEHFEIVNGCIHYVELVKQCGQPPKLVVDPYMVLVQLRIEHAAAMPIFLAAVQDYQALDDSIDELLECMRAIEGAAPITAPTSPTDPE